MFRLFRKSNMQVLSDYILFAILVSFKSDLSAVKYSHYVQDIRRINKILKKLPEPSKILTKQSIDYWKEYEYCWNVDKLIETKSLPIYKKIKKELNNKANNLNGSDYAQIITCVKRDKFEELVIMLRANMYTLHNRVSMSSSKFWIDKWTSNVLSSDDFLERRQKINTEINWNECLGKKQKEWDEEWDQSCKSMGCSLNTGKCPECDFHILKGRDLKKYQKLGARYINKLKIGE